MSLKLYYTYLFTVCSFEKIRHIFVVKQNKYFSPVHISCFRIIPTVSLAEFKSFFYKLDRYVGSFCATHRLAQVVLLPFKVEIFNHNSIYCTFPFICNIFYNTILFKKVIHGTKKRSAIAWIPFCNSHERTASAQQNFHRSLKVNSSCMTATTVETNKHFLLCH